MNEGVGARDKVPRGGVVDFVELINEVIKLNYVLLGPYEVSQPNHLRPLSPRPLSPYFEDHIE